MTYINSSICSRNFFPHCNIEFHQNREWTLIKYLLKVDVNLNIFVFSPILLTVKCQILSIFVQKQHSGKLPSLCLRGWARVCVHVTSATRFEVRCSLREKYEFTYLTQNTTQGLASPDPNLDFTNGLWHITPSLPHCLSPLPFTLLGLFLP